MGIRPTTMTTHMKRLRRRLPKVGFIISTFQFPAVPAGPSFLVGCTEKPFGRPATESCHCKHSSAAECRAERFRL
jgi:hypothetical protein